jgi:hypothetical protein
MSQQYIFDAYAIKQDATLMHFDVILAENHATRAFQVAELWLQTQVTAPQKFTLKSCNFCHSSKANPRFTQAIQQQGYAILPLDGCAP